MLKSLVCRRSSLLAMLALGACAGCGSSTATVSGTVTYGKHPLPYGTVQLFTEKGEVFSCLIDENGGYVLHGVPTGAARLAVVTHPEVPHGLQIAPPPAHPHLGPPQNTPRRRFVPIPERYSVPDRSGLTLTVVAGAQNHAIQLNP